MLWNYFMKPVIQPHWSYLYRRKYWKRTNNFCCFLFPVPSLHFARYLSMRFIPIQCFRGRKFTKLVVKRIHYVRFLSSILIVLSLLLYDFSFLIWLLNKTSQLCFVFEKRQKKIILTRVVCFCFFVSLINFSTSLLPFFNCEKKIFLFFLDTRLRQQKLPAWQPILTASTVIPTVFVIGVVFIPIGAVLYTASQSGNFSFHCFFAFFPE